MKRVLKSLFIIFISFILCEILFLSLPRIINVDKYKTQISDYIYKYTGLNTVLNGIEVKTSPNFLIHITVDETKVYTNERYKMLDVKNLEITSQIPNIFTKKVKVKNIKTSKMMLSLFRDYNGNFNIPAINIEQLPIIPQINKTTINIYNYNINFKDDKHKENIKFIGEIIKIDKFDPKSYIKLKIKGILKSNKKSNDIDLEIESKLPLKIETLEKDLFIKAKITKFPLYIYQKYISEFLNTEISNISGEVTLDVETLKGEDKIIQIKSKVNNLKLETPYDILKLKDETKFNGRIDIKNNEVKTDSNITNNTFKIKIKGNLKDKKNETNINIIFNDASIETLLGVLPSYVSKKCINEICNAKKYGVFGVLNGGINLKGAINKPEIYGKLKCEEVYLVNEIEGIKNANVNADFKGDRFILNAKLYSAEDQWVNVKGYSEIYGERKGEYDIQSTKDINLKTIMHSLIPLKHIIGFKLGPLPYMEIYGVGNIKLKAKGTLEEGLLYGDFNFRNTKATYNGIKGTITDAKGNLHFNGENMMFKTQSAKLLNNNIQIWGRANISGDFDFNTLSEDINIEKITEILRSSPQLSKYACKLNSVEKIVGKGNINLNLKGKIDEKNGKDLLDGLKPELELILKDASVKLKDLSKPLTNIYGTINYKDDNIKLDLISQNQKEKIYIKTDKKNQINITSESIELKNCIGYIEKYIKNIPNINKIDSKIKLNIKYTGDIENIDLNKVIINTDFIESNSQNVGDIKISNGNFVLVNNCVELNNINANIYNSQVEINGKAKNIFNIEKLEPYITINCENFNVSALNTIKNTQIEPAQLAKLFQVYSDFKGNAKFNINIKNKKANGYISFSNVKFNHEKLKIPIEINSGKINILNNKVWSDSLSMLIDKTPVFLKGEITDINNPYYKAYMTMKLNQSFIDKRLNSILIYPLKIKGDISFSVEAIGNMKSLVLKPDMKINEGSDITYMGSSFGDEEYLRELKAIINVKEDKINVENFIYQKQKQEEIKSIPIKMLQGNCYMTIMKNNNFIINSMHIKTFNPNEARLLNIPFKKSFFKTGKFNCDIYIKGNLKEPKIFGNFTLNNAFIPSINTKINNIEANFKNNEVDIKSEGSYVETNYKITTKIKDYIKKTKSIENIEFQLNKFDADRFIDLLSSRNSNIKTNTIISAKEATAYKFNPKMYLINNAKIKIDEVILNGEKANNLTANLYLTEDSQLKIENINCKTLEGKIEGKSSYNFDNNEIKADLNLYGVDANAASHALLDVKNQIYGKLDGNIKLTTHGENETKRLENLKGNVFFEIKDGRLPKLGALEYLLRADNIVRGCFIRLTVNNIIDLVVPIKTGYFSTIKGDFNVKNGIADDIVIYSKGDNLSIYVNGNYNFTNSNGKLDIYGKLSKSALSLIGPLGNASLNSLFKLIPGIENENRDEITKIIDKIPDVVNNKAGARAFEAKIDGIIDEEAYDFVKSFKWLEK